MDPKKLLPSKILGAMEVVDNFTEPEAPNFGLRQGQGLNSGSKRSAPATLFRGSKGGKQYGRMRSTSSKIPKKASKPSSDGDGAPPRRSPESASTSSSAAAAGGEGQDRQDRQEHLRLMDELDAFTHPRDAGSRDGAFADEAMRGGGAPRAQRHKEGKQRRGKRGGPRGGLGCSLQACAVGILSSYSSRPVSTEPVWHGSPSTLFVFKPPGQ